MHYKIPKLSSGYYLPLLISPWASGWAFLKVYFAIHNLKDMVQEIMSVTGGKIADTGN